MPIDVSADHLRQVAEGIARDFPRLEVVAVCADYTQPFALPAEVMMGHGRRVGFFPGSSIGNLEPHEAEEFLSLWGRQLGGEGAMLVGVDLRKDAEILRLAYNDAQGVTARFTLNLLARANRELGTDFDLSAFAHDAEWQDDESRISINLKSLKDQEVRLDGQRLQAAAGRADPHRIFLQVHGRRLRRAGAQGRLRAPRGVDRRGEDVLASTTSKSLPRVGARQM